MVTKLDLGLLALGALAVFLTIRGAGQFLQGLGNPLAGLQLPSIGDITFPSFPEINIPNPFAPQQINIPNPFQPNPNDGSSIRDDDAPVNFVNPQPSGQPPGSSVFIRNTGDGTTTIFRGGTEIATPEGPFLPQDRPLFLDQIEQVVNNVQQPQAQLNQGGFQGQATEAPIGALSLGRIIERFGVTASQAANIQAQAQNNFGNFDFGTNTGSGIGSVTTQPIINTQFGGGNVSNPQFEGLSPVEIARRLTGGNISNF